MISYFIIDLFGTREQFATTFKGDFCPVGIARLASRFSLKSDAKSFVKEFGLLKDFPNLRFVRFRVL